MHVTVRFRRRRPYVARICKSTYNDYNLFMFMFDCRVYRNARFRTTPCMLYDGRIRSISDQIFNILTLVSKTFEQSQLRWYIICCADRSNKRIPVIKENTYIMQQQQQQEVAADSFLHWRIYYSNISYKIFHYMVTICLWIVSNMSQ